MNPIKRREFLGTIGIGTTVAALGNVSGQLEAAPPASTLSSKRRLFTSGREDGRFIDMAGFIHSTMKMSPPKLAFDPSMEAEDFPAWQKSVQEKLFELMAFPEVAKQPPPKRLWIRTVLELEVAFRCETRGEHYCVNFTVVHPGATVAMC